MGERESELSLVVVIIGLAAVWAMMNVHQIVLWKARWLKLLRHWRLRERKP